MTEGSDRTPGFPTEPIDWQALRTSTLSPVRVAVIDSGIHANHPTLEGRLAIQWRPDPETESGWRASGPPFANRDRFGHGTAVAGIICELAPNAMLEEYRVPGHNAPDGASQTLSALEAAIAGEAAVINMSLALSRRYRRELLELCEQVYQRRKLLIAAQRNFPEPDAGYPAELAACLGVSMHDEDSPFALHYQPGAAVRLRARGRAVEAPTRDGASARFTGTSFATPTVTGLCSLLLGTWPELEAFEIRALLKRMAIADPASE